METKITKDETKPTTASGRIPLWIKIMWLLGVIWIVTYILLGLRHTPFTW